MKSAFNWEIWTVKCLLPRGEHLTWRNKGGKNKRDVFINDTCAVAKVSWLTRKRKIMTLWCVQLATLVKDLMNQLRNPFQCNLSCFCFWKKVSSSWLYDATFEAGSLLSALFTDYELETSSLATNALICFLLVLETRLLVCEEMLDMDTYGLLVAAIFKTLSCVLVWNYFSSKQTRSVRNWFFWSKSVVWVCLFVCLFWISTFLL